eukprot:TRINITY_DN37498_c0_g3_i1.p1 TRINITY_DN37498_c0_g3~~TRINITY_DN37498_c0_g3_i1.p1  ORF type:complete len:107 (+),score=23.87 TRINITY_DN37498_c0_g3_i1:38-322(+)
MGNQLVGQTSKVTTKLAPGTVPKKPSQDNLTDSTDQFTCIRQEFSQGLQEMMSIITQTQDDVRALQGDVAATARELESLRSVIAKQGTLNVSSA